MNAPRAREGTPRSRLLVLASTFPAGPDDGTPAFVRDLAGPVSRRLKRAVLRRATAVTAMNADMADRLVGLGSRIPGIDAAVVDSDSGLLVPPGDPAALATALTGLLGDPDRRARLAAAASARADDFSVDAAGHRYCALLRTVAGRAGRQAEPARAGGAR